MVLIAAVLSLTYGNYLGTRQFLLNPRGETMKRYGSVIGLRPEKLDEYVRLHAAVWPNVLKMIRECNIRNYSIYLRRLPDGAVISSATSSTWAMTSPPTWPRWRPTP